MPSISINVGPAARGGTAQAVLKLSGQSMRGSFAWGSAPGSATLVYAGTAAAVSIGARLDFTIGGHYFAGLCKSDTVAESTGGTLRTLEFVDLRYYLTWDWVFGSWNLPDVRLVNGRRVKRYAHIHPADWATQQRTFTDQPLPASQILQESFQAPTIFTAWRWDLTSNGLFPDGLLNAPVYDIEAGSGMRLDALLNLICEKTGLVFTLDPRPALANGDTRLVFTRKGCGVLPLPFPANSDTRSMGLTLTDNPMNICVVGDRNKYQLLNVPMIKDWSAPWELYFEPELFVKDIYDHEIDPVSGSHYNAFTDDPDHWHGYGAAKVRASEITVAQYITLRTARGGTWATTAPGFADPRKYAGRWRMDLPAMLYITALVFRAFRPNISGFTNVNGDTVSLASTPIADQLLCRVMLEYGTGAMTSIPTEPVEGNGLLAVKGYQFGEELFRLAAPDRIHPGFFQAAARGWSSVNFQIDDSGEGTRFLLAEQPVFVGSEANPLIVEVDGYAVLNADFDLAAPEVKAALVFDAERYTYWLGTGWSGKRTPNPNAALPGRNRVEAVNGLQMEFVADYVAPVLVEIPYADNQTADGKANLIAETLLLTQRAYLVGGYNLVWRPSQALSSFGVPLAPSDSSCIDRINITHGPGGITEVVDFTCERARDYFEPERELDRRSIQNSLFPGQQELRHSTNDQRRLNAGLRSLGNLMGLFQKVLSGEVDGNLKLMRFVSGASLPTDLPVGTPLVMVPTSPGAAGNSTAVAPAAVPTAGAKVFVGLTVRHNEPTGGAFRVQQSGDGYARVQGPVAVGDGLGLSSAGGGDFGTNGAYLTKGSGVGQAIDPITGTAIKLIRVRLSTAKGGGHFRKDWSPTEIYNAEDEVCITTGGPTMGSYIALVDGLDNTIPPAQIRKADGTVCWYKRPSAAGPFL